MARYYRKSFAGSKPNIFARLARIALAFTICVDLFGFPLGGKRQEPSPESSGSLERFRQNWGHLPANPELRTDLRRLDYLRSSGKLRELGAEVKVTAPKWQAKSRPEYMTYISEACSVVSSYAIGDTSQRYQLLGELALSVLSTGELSIEETVYFVYFLGANPFTIDPGDWKTLRRRKSEWWLSTWQELNGLTQRDFDFADAPFMNIAPPGGGMSGMAPEDIKDPKQRREYEDAIKKNIEKGRVYNAQFWLRQNAPRFYIDAENFLADAYSRPPFDDPELTAILRRYVTDEGTRKRIASKARLMRE